MKLSGNSSLVKTGAIAGLINKQGQPVADVTVMITGDSPSHNDIAALTNERGEYRFDDLLPGDYTIIINPETGRSQTKFAKVEAGRITLLDFSLVY